MNEIIRVKDLFFTVALAFVGSLPLNFPSPKTNHRKFHGSMGEPFVEWKSVYTVTRSRSISCPFEFSISLIFLPHSAEKQSSSFTGKQTILDFRLMLSADLLFQLYVLLFSGCCVCSFVTSAKKTLTERNISPIVLCKYLFYSFLFCSFCRRKCCFIFVWEFECCVCVIATVAAANRNEIESESTMDYYICWYACMQT